MTPRDKFLKLIETDILRLNHAAGSNTFAQGCPRFTN